MTKIFISTLTTNIKSLRFRLKRINKTINFLFEEIKNNDLISEKQKKICGKYLNYDERFLILDSTITRCVSFSAFTS